MNFNNPRNLRYHPDEGEEDDGEDDFAGYYLDLSREIDGRAVSLPDQVLWHVCGPSPLIYTEPGRFIPHCQSGTVEEDKKEQPEEEYEDDQEEEGEEYDQNRFVSRSEDLFVPRFEGHRVCSIQIVEEEEDRSENLNRRTQGTRHTIGNVHGIERIRFIESVVPQGLAFEEQSSSRLQPKITNGRNIIFTDGSFQSPDKSGYGIFMGLSHPLNRAVKLDKPHSSGRAEVQAIIQSLLSLLTWNDRPKAVVEIFTDCLFAILALHHVRARRTGRTEPPMNQRYKEHLELFLHELQEELNVLIVLTQRFENGVRISFIKSHCGEYGNERADLYATIGRLGNVSHAMRLKSYTDSQRTTPSELVKRLRERPFIAFRTTRAELNMSRLILNIDDRQNTILYPRQQVVWSPEHHVQEESIRCEFD